VYLVLRSDAVDVVYGTMDGYAALGIPYRPHIAPSKRWVNMANEKVDVVIVGAGASGSVFAAVLAKAGKKVVILEQGPDWQLADLISSDFWGRRIKPASGPVPARRQKPVRLCLPGGMGRRRRGAPLLCQLPAAPPERLQDQERATARALDWPISYQDVAPYYDKVAQDVGCPRETPRRKKFGGRRECLIPCRR